MARRDILTAVVLIGFAAGAYAQYFDFYQALQPLVQSYTTPKRPAYDHIYTTKRPRTTVKHKTTHNDQTGRTRDGARRTPVAISGLEPPYDNSRRMENTIAPYETRVPSTPKPPKKTSKPTQSNQNPKTNRANSRNMAREIAANQRDSSRSPSRIVYEEQFSANSFDTGAGRRREHAGQYETGTKANHNANRGSNVYTTQNPFYNRPGVRPPPVDDSRPPITNRPPTVTEDAAIFPDPTSPELIIGPNEDSMSEVEKRRYIELSERMCDRYKNLHVKQLQAIPLVPSPKPIQINVTTCVPSNVPLVVGGKVVTIREFPHMALIGWLKLHTSGYAWRCGGSLVSNQFVLTAAHCAYDERDNNIVMGTPRVVQLGSSYLDDPGALVVKVSAVVRHPKYKQPRSYYDIALVKLATTVTFSEVVQPACLGVPPSAGKPIIATGWGRTEFGGEQSTELRSVSIPVWGMGECAEVLGTSRRLPSGPSPDSQICAGEKNGGKDTCQGDSGGPAQIQEGCVWRVVAVTSLGRACGAPNTPALYAKVQRAFVASVAFGKLVANDGGGDTNSGGSDNKHTTKRPTYNGGGDTNSGDHNRFVDNKHTQPTYNGGGSADSGVNAWNSGGNRQTEKPTRFNGGGSNRATTERQNNGGGTNSAVANDRWDIGNDRQVNAIGGRPANNNRGSQNDNWNHNRQDYNNDYVNSNSQSNSVEKRDQGFNSGYNAQRQNGNNNRQNPQNNNYSSYNNPFFNDRPTWWT